MVCFLERLLAELVNDVLGAPVEHRHGGDGVNPEAPYELCQIQLSVYFFLRFVHQSAISGLLTTEAQIL